MPGAPGRGGLLRAFTSPSRVQGLGFKALGFRVPSF